MEGDRTHIGTSVRVTAAQIGQIWRLVEAVVHGLDLADALGHDPIATPEGVAMTAALFDELLARLTVPGCPAGLSEDLAWVRAASGRAPHSDPRLPLLG